MTASLPPDAFTSAAFLKLEDAKLWPRSWVCIGASQEIPNAGDLLPYTVGVHGIHVQRQADGSLVGRFNKAQHGGCHFIPIQCQTGKKTRCGFTSCGYSLDRAAIPAGPSGEAVPEMYQYLGMRPDRLGTILTLEKSGLLFVSLAAEPEPPPALPQLPSCAMAAGWTTMHANWKLVAASLAASGQSTWLFPNLLLLPDAATVFGVIVQPTAPNRTTCRTILFQTAAGDDHAPVGWQDLLDRHAAVAKAAQAEAEAGGCSYPIPPDFLAWLMARLQTDASPPAWRQTTAYPLNPRYDFVA